MLSITTETMTRVPRIHALPWQTPGFTLIRSRQFCICLFYSHCADERHPALMYSRLAKGNPTLSANTAERGPLRGVFADRGAATRPAFCVTAFFSSWLSWPLSFGVPSLAHNFHPRAC